MSSEEKNYQNNGTGYGETKSTISSQQQEVLTQEQFETMVLESISQMRESGSTVTVIPPSATPTSRSQVQVNFVPRKNLTKKVESLPSSIITDRKHGEAFIKKYADEFSEDGWELVIHGTGDQSMLNQWECMFYINRTRDRKSYGLKIVDFGDPCNEANYDENGEIIEEEDEAYEEPEVYESLVAFWPEPPIDDENAVARILLATYEKHGGKFVNYQYSIGRFDLGAEETDDEYIKFST